MTIIICPLTNCMYNTKERCTLDVMLIDRNGCDTYMQTSEVLKNAQANNGMEQKCLICGKPKLFTLPGGEKTCMPRNTKRSEK